jgi:hypothetical protein
MFPSTPLLQSVRDLDLLVQAEPYLRRSLHQHLLHLQFLRQLLLLHLHLHLHLHLRL